MERADRAKQFMPFDALKGFRKALEEKERMIVPKRELSEEQKDKLNRIIQQIKKKDILTATYSKWRIYSDNRYGSVDRWNCKGT